MQYNHKIPMECTPWRSPNQPPKRRDVDNDVGGGVLNY